MIKDIWHPLAVLLGGQTESQIVAQAAAVAGPQAKVTHAAAVAFDPYKGFIPPMTTHFYTYKGLA